MRICIRQTVHGWCDDNAWWSGWVAGVVQGAELSLYVTELKSPADSSRLGSLLFGGFRRRRKGGCRKALVNVDGLAWV